MGIEWATVGIYAFASYPGNVLAVGWCWAMTAATLAWMAQLIRLEAELRLNAKKPPTQRTGWEAYEEEAELEELTELVLDVGQGSSGHGVRDHDDRGADSSVA